MSLPLRLLRASLASLWAFKSYALLMMIGLIIGIASLTVIQEIGHGARVRVQGIMESFGFGADAFYISAGGGRLGRRHGLKRTINLTPQDVEEIRRLEGVAMVVPHKGVARTKISAGGKHMTSRLMGVTPNWVTIRNLGLSQGRFITQEDEDRRARVAVLGATPVRELFGGKSPLGKRIRIGNTPFLVVGVLQPLGGSRRGRDRDDRVMVPLATAVKRLSRSDNYSGMRVNLSDPDQREQVVQETTQLLRRLHKLPEGVPDDFLIVTPDELLDLITRQSRAMVAMLSFISAVSLFVSGIVIMNIMLVAVSERSYEIGVRRAVGARRRDILGQILMESTLVALAGGLCGLGLGFVLSWLATLLLEVPTAFSPLGFAWAVGFSAAVGLVFGLAPAKKAAGLTPVEALR